MIIAGSWIDVLSDWISALPVGGMPADIIEKGSLIFADTFGAILAGASDDTFQKFATRYAGGAGATVLGMGLVAAPDRTAFLNGMAGTIAELDEGNYAAGGHPGIHAVPAALATAEQCGASGRQMLDAVILGYEVGARIGAACRLLPEVHSHGTWGTIGAAVATARLRRFDRKRLAVAIRIAAPLSIAASGSAGINGASVRGTYAGLAASNGITACDLAEAGVTGEHDSIGIVYGRILGRDFDGAKILEGLGSRWSFNRTFFKLFASCRETHGAIEAWRTVVGPRAIDPAAIRSIEVATFHPASSLSERAPQTALAARFSIPFVLATFIRRARAGNADFVGGTLRDPLTLDLARRIVVVEDKLANAPPPKRRATSIRIDLGSEKLQGQIFGAAGDPERPVAREELRAKFEREAGNEGHLGLSFDSLLGLCGDLADSGVQRALAKARWSDRRVAIS